MPIHNEINDDQNGGQLLRILAYGESGRKKTWWAARAADAGFNVLYVNSDKPSTIIKQITPEGRKRIREIECITTYNMSEFFARFFNRSSITWDDTDGKVVSRMDNPEHSYFVIDRTKLTNSDVLIVDSWTGLSTATLHKLADEKTIDLSEVDKIDWGLFGATGLFHNWLLEQLKKLPCHVIVIGHADTWEKNKKGKDGKLLPDIEFSRVQPVSSSRPHAKTMAKFFTDTLFFTMIGNQNKIDTTSMADRDSGSTNFPPKMYNWDDLQFVDICKVAPAFIPDGAQDMPGVIYYRPGEAPIQAPPAGNKTLAATPATATPLSGGLAGLLKK